MQGAQVRSLAGELRFPHAMWPKNTTTNNKLINKLIKYDTNELMYETDSQTENRFVVAKVVGRDGLGVWD